MAKEQCTNVTPLKEDVANFFKGEIINGGTSHEAYCPSCGRYLGILNSGNFRKHATK